jgi:UDP-glucuronate 4-epimerase
MGAGQMNILVTGSSGFVGFHLARQLLSAGHPIIGLDGLTAYYDPRLKRDRQALLTASPQFSSHEFMLEESDRLAELVATAKPDAVVHLAAQAGVRYSLENPRAYIDSNIVGTFNLLEACRLTPPKHLLIASTSSVYGNGTELPFSEAAESSQPVSLYAATKKATEVIAHSYSHLHLLPTTVFRFFTVYGPWGRPDMALFKFTEAILNGREIELYGEGRMSRDFTFVGDLVEAIAALIALPPDQSSLKSGSVADSPVAPCRIVNVGASRPADLDEFVQAIEAATGKRARRKSLPMQPGDVRQTWADVGELRSLVELPAATPLAEGVRRFVEWYRDYYRVETSVA